MLRSIPTGRLSCAGIEGGTPALPPTRRRSIGPAAPALVAAACSSIFAYIARPLRASTEPAADLATDGIEEFLRDAADTSAAWNELMVVALRRA